MPIWTDSSVETELYRISKPIIVSDKKSAFPDVAVDSNGKPWMTWVQSTSDGERVVVKCISDDVDTSSISVTESPGIVLQPCIVSLGHGSLRVFWISYEDESWRLLTRSINGSELSSIVTVAENPDGLFGPRAALDSRGHCHVVCEIVAGSKTSIAVFRQTLNAWSTIDAEISEDDCFRPQICMGPEKRLWISYDNYDDYSYRIVLQMLSNEHGRADDQRIIIAEDGFQNVHSSLACDSEDNLWIAFASNRNVAARDAAWLTKWSFVYRFDGTSLTMPAGDRPDVDIYQEDAYQGWEFPAVSVSGGHVVMVGQSAHSLLFQSYSDSTWSNTETIVDRKWGSWKPKCRLAGTDTIYIASMGLQGAQIQRLEFTADPALAEMVMVQPSDRKLLASKQTAPASPRNEIVSPDDETYNVYFGDLHAHSVYSDAIGEVDEFYRRYRDLYHYDFAALTDHDYLDGIELTRSELKMIWNHASRMSSPEEFIAWFGYEWTSPAISVHAEEGTTVGEGHRHVLYPDDTGPLISYGDPDSNTGAKLLSKLEGLRALVIPHHTSWSGTDWEAHDPELQRVVEVVSTHGRFEFAGNKPIGYRRDHLHPDKFVQDALSRGYRLGFVGGSDSHGLRWHAIELDGRADHIEEGTRVGWKEDAYRTGMTAILAQKLDRESLFDAVYHRRCYATSGVRIFLDFRVDQHLMGSEINVSTAPTLSVSVKGTTGLRAVEIVREGQVFGGVQFVPGECIQTSTFEMVDSMLIPGESVYYYCRVIQEDGNMAWSSPIWVTYVK